MWSTLKISSGAQIGHVKWDIPAFDTVLFHSNLSSLRRKYLSDVPTDKIVLSCRPKISKCHFRFVERRFLAANNCTESAEGALVPVFFRITHWPKSGLPVSPPGLFQCRTLSFDLVVLVSTGTRVSVDGSASGSAGSDWKWYSDDLRPGGHKGGGEGGGGERWCSKTGEITKWHCMRVNVWCMFLQGLSSLAVKSVIFMLTGAEFNLG